MLNDDTLEIGQIIYRQPGNTAAKVTMTGEKGFTVEYQKGLTKGIKARYVWDEFGDFFTIRPV